MRLVIMVTLPLFVSVVSASVDAKLADTEHDRGIAYIAFLESSPFDTQAAAMRAWLVDWEDKSKDVVDIVCPDLFQNWGQVELPLISRTSKSEDNPRTEVFDGKALEF